MISIEKNINPLSKRFIFPLVISISFFLVSHVSMGATTVKPVVSPSATIKPVSASNTKVSPPASGTLQKPIQMQPLGPAPMTNSNNNSQTSGRENQGSQGRGPEDSGSRNPASPGNDSSSKPAASKLAPIKPVSASDTKVSVPAVTLKNPPQQQRSDSPPNNNSNTNPTSQESFAPDHPAPRTEDSGSRNPASPGNDSSSKPAASKSDALKPAPIKPASASDTKVSPPALTLKNPVQMQPLGPAPMTNSSNSQTPRIENQGSQGRGPEDSGSRNPASPGNDSSSKPAASKSDALKPAPIKTASASDTKVSPPVLTLKNPVQMQPLGPAPIPNSNNNFDKSSALKPAPIKPASASDTKVSPPALTKKPITERVSSNIEKSNSTNNSTNKGKPAPSLSGNPTSSACESSTCIDNRFQAAKNWTIRVVERKDTKVIVLKDLNDFLQANGGNKVRQSDFDYAWDQAKTDLSLSRLAGRDLGRDIGKEARGLNTHLGPGRGSRIELNEQALNPHGENVRSNSTWLPVGNNSILDGTATLFHEFLHSITDHVNGGLPVPWDVVGEGDQGSLGHRWIDRLTNPDEGTEAYDRIRRSFSETEINYEGTLGGDSGPTEEPALDSSDNALNEDFLNNQLENQQRRDERLRARQDTSPDATIDPLNPCPGCTVGETGYGGDLGTTPGSPGGGADQPSSSETFDPVANRERLDAVYKAMEEARKEAAAADAKAEADKKAEAEAKAQAEAQAKAEAEAKAKAEAKPTSSSPTTSSADCPGGYTDETGAEICPEDGKSNNSSPKDPIDPSGGQRGGNTSVNPTSRDGGPNDPRGGDDQGRQTGGGNPNGLKPINGLTGDGQGNQGGVSNPNGLKPGGPSVKAGPSLNKGSSKTNLAPSK